MVIGFRACGAASIYFGEDPAYHFNTAGHLPGRTSTGALIKAERGHLIAMSRTRTPGEVQLRSHQFTAAESESLLANLCNRVMALAQDLAAGRFQAIGQVPADADIIGRARTFLSSLAGGITIATSPRVH